MQFIFNLSLEELIDQSTHTHTHTHTRARAHTHIYILGGGLHTSRMMHYINIIFIPAIQLVVPKAKWPMTADVIIYFITL